MWFMELNPRGLVNGQSKHIFVFFDERFRFRCLSFVSFWAQMSRCNFFFFGKCLNEKLPGLTYVIRLCMETKNTCQQMGWGTEIFKAIFWNRVPSKKNVYFAFFFHFDRISIITISHQPRQTVIFYEKN